MNVPRLTELLEEVQRERGLRLDILRMDDMVPRKLDQRTTDERLGDETAFPLPDGHTQVRRWQAGYGEYRTTAAVATGGLTKRELFAAMAMQGIFGSDVFKDMTPVAHAKEAVLIADALLKELAK